MEQIEIREIYDASKLALPKIPSSKLVNPLHLRSSNAVLLAENNMFERFLCRMDQLDPHAGASGFGGTGSTQLDVGVRDIPTHHLVHEKI